MTSFQVILEKLAMIRSTLGFKIFKGCIQVVDLALNRPPPNPWIHPYLDPFQYHLWRFLFPKMFFGDKYATLVYIKFSSFPCFNCKYIRITVSHFKKKMQHFACNKSPESTKVHPSPAHPCWNSTPPLVPVRWVDFLGVNLESNKI